MPPGSRVYYKFKSTAKFKTIDLVDHWVSVAELKPLIAQKEGLSADDSTELLLSDPRTGEEFRDATKQIAQNSSIVVRRVPVIRHDALLAKQEPAAIVPGLSLPGLGPSQQGGGSLVSKVGTASMVTDGDAFGGAVYDDQPASDGNAANPINDIMQRMVRQQAESHRQQVMDQKAGRGATMGRGRGRGAVAAAGRGAFIQRDLSEFTCSWCGVKGDHFEKDCPAPDKLVKRIRHASGVPNGALAPSAEGGLLLPNGQYGAIVPNTAGFQAAVAPMLSLTTTTAAELLPASRVPAPASVTTANTAHAISGVQSGIAAISPPAPPLALPQPANKPSAHLSTGTEGSMPQFAGDDLLESGNSMSSAAGKPPVGLPGLAAPMTPAEFEHFKQQQLGLKLQLKPKDDGYRSGSRSHRSNSRSHYRSRRSRSRSRSRRRYSRSSSRSRSRSRDRSRDRHRRGSRHSRSYSRSRSPSLHRGRSRSSRSPSRYRGRPYADDSRQYAPPHFQGHAALPVPAQLLQLEDAPMRHQSSADLRLQPMRQHRLASSSRNSPPADPARDQSLSTRHKETAVAPRQRSPVPRRPALDRRSSPPKPDLSPSTSNHDRWSHDGEASDAAAAIAQNERLAADEAKQQQIAEEQAAAEEAERTRQAERARLEAASERQRLADQRRILEKAEKQLQSEKHAVKQAAEEAERQRVAAEERRLALERKQAAASHELSRKPSLHERISLRPNASSRPKDKRQRSPSVVRSQTFSSSDTYSRSPSVDRRDRQTSTAGHRKHGGRLRSISPPRDSPALVRSRSRRKERLQVLGGDLPSRFTVALEDSLPQRSHRSKQSKVKKESKHKHKKDHSSKTSKASKRKHEHKGLRRSLEARLSPARHDLSTSHPPPQSPPELVVSQPESPPASGPALQEPTGKAKVHRIKANRPLFALAMGDTKKKKAKKFGSG